MARFGTESPHRSGVAAPVRTCVGCRGRECRSALLRVVARPGEAGRPGTGPVSIVIPDPDGSLPGRGAWIHPTAECMRAAERRRAFGRALRVRGNPDTRPVVEFLSRD